MKESKEKKVESFLVVPYGPLIEGENKRLDEKAIKYETEKGAIKATIKQLDRDEVKSVRIIRKEEKA